jgi:hypothetical protein
MLKINSYAVAEATKMISEGKLTGYSGETWANIHDILTGTVITINDNPVAKHASNGRWAIDDISYGNMPKRYFDRTNTLEGMMEEFGLKEEECEIGEPMNHDSCVAGLQLTLETINCLVAEGRAIITPLVDEVPDCSPAGERYNSGHVTDGHPDDQVMPGWMK